MGSFAKSLFKLLFGWFEGLASNVWKTVSAPVNNGNVSIFGSYWLPLLILLCLVGITIDLLVYMIRWKPHWVWKSSLGRLLGKERMPLDNDESSELLMNNQDKQIQEQQFTSQTKNKDNIDFERWIDKTDTEKTDTVPDPYSAYRKPEVSGVYNQNSNGNTSAAPSANRVTNGRIRRTERKTIATDSDVWKIRSRNREEGLSQRERFSRAIRNQKNRDRELTVYSEDRPDRVMHVPAPAIDRKEAYRDPVYPPKWNQNNTIGDEKE